MQWRGERFFSFTFSSLACCVDPVLFGFEPVLENSGTLIRGKNKYTWIFLAVQSTSDCDYFAPCKSPRSLWLGFATPGSKQKNAIPVVINHKWNYKFRSVKRLFIKHMLLNRNVCYHQSCLEDMLQMKSWYEFLASCLLSLPRKFSSNFLVVICKRILVDCLVLVSYVRNAKMILNFRLLFQAYETTALQCAWTFFPLRNTNHQKCFLPCIYFNNSTIRTHLMKSIAL